MLSVSANGHFVDQFIQDVVNKRTDEYGGCIENRSRFVLELIQEVANAIGQKRLALRLSPYNTSEGMGMEDPIPQFTHLVSELAHRHPKLAYLHVMEPRVSRVSGIVKIETTKTLEFLRDIWRPTRRPFLSSGGYTPASTFEHVAKPGQENEMVVFGRYFISNPDLPKRIMQNIPLNPYNRSTFCSPETSKGYADYPFAEVEA